MKTQNWLWSYQFNNKVKKMRNPSWSREENILALDFFLRHRKTRDISETSPDFETLVENINKLGELHDLPRTETFRNKNGIYLTVENFVHLDPTWDRQGISGISKERRKLWEDLADKPDEVAALAHAIIEHINQAETDNTPLLADISKNDLDMTAPSVEGRLLSASHLRRERDPRLVEKLKDDYFDKNGYLDCAVCTFDFEQKYGRRGHKFMEAHHIRPLSSLSPKGEQVKLDDLALLCANCHRMIHRFSPWWTVEELQGVFAGHKK